MEKPQLVDKFAVGSIILKNSNYALSTIVRNFEVEVGEYGIFLSGRIGKRNKYICKHITNTTLRQLLVSEQIL